MTPILFGGVKLPGHPDLDNIRLMDANIIRPIARMQRFGIAIDLDYLRELGSEFGAILTSLKREIIEFIPEDRLNEFVSADDSSDDIDDPVIDFNPNSSPQKAKLLFDILGIADGQQVKRSRSGNISTDRKQLEKFRRNHPIIPKLLKYSEYAKLKSTYCDGLPKLARFHNKGSCRACGGSHESDHMRIHTDLPTTRTDTGRLASRRPNLQNIPARTEAGRRVRKAFIASEGQFLVSVDYSQIEMRWMADRSNDPKLIQAFLDNVDIHTRTACQIFSKTEAEVESKLGKLLYRAPAKTASFGNLYGQQALGLLDTLIILYAQAEIDIPSWLDVDWCDNFRTDWFNLYSNVKGYLDEQSYRARRYGITWCAFGGVRRIPEIHSAHERIRAAGLRQAGNNPIQRGAAGIFKIGLARVAGMLARLRTGDARAELLLPIHDELLVEADESVAEEVAAMMQWEMERALMDDCGKIHSRVPIKTEGSIMQRWEKA